LAGNKQAAAITSRREFGELNENEGAARNGAPLYSFLCNGRLLQRHYPQGHEP